jgi:drug/metabolite transporter (DMT)-like permease
MGEHFRLPIFLTFLHMVVSYVFCEFSAEMGWIQRIAIRSRAEAGKVFLLSQSLALCVVLSVASFRYVEVSLEQALSASTPVFTALLGMVILGRRERTRVWLTFLPVVGGAMVTAGGEPSLHVLGVTLVFASNIVRATKSCMQELLLGRDAMDSLNLLRWMSVFSMITLIPLSLAFEGPTVIYQRLSYVYHDERLLLALVANCCGAFMTNLTQFMVTEYVGALSMQVHPPTPPPPREHPTPVPPAS